MASNVPPVQSSGWTWSPGSRFFSRKEDICVARSAAMTMSLPWSWRRKVWEGFTVMRMVARRMKEERGKMKEGGLVIGNW